MQDTGEKYFHLNRRNNYEHLRVPQIAIVSRGIAVAKHCECLEHHWKGTLDVGTRSTSRCGNFVRIHLLRGVVICEWMRNWEHFRHSTGSAADAGT
jgi:hypothetical protein